MYLTKLVTIVMLLIQTFLPPELLFLPINCLLCLYTLQAPDEIQLLKNGPFYNIRSSSRPIAMISFRVSEQVRRVIFARWHGPIFCHFWHVIFNHVGHIWN